MLRRFESSVSDATAHSNLLLGMQALDQHEMARQKAPQNSSMPSCGGFPNRSKDEADTKAKEKEKRPTTRRQHTVYAGRFAGSASEQLIDHVA